MKTIDFLRERNVDIDAALELLGDEDFYNETLNDFYSSYQERRQQLETFNGSEEKFLQEYRKFVFRVS